jgi:hypothetical protein
MKNIYRPLCLALIFGVFGHPIVRAKESATAEGCTFNVPQTVLQKNAYSRHTFTKLPANRALEAARVRKNLRVEISHNQCVDFITSELTFIVPSGSTSKFDERYWLQFAQDEIQRLKLNPLAGDYQALRRFLTRARQIAPRNGARSLCRDGSVAEAGQCSWESTGGFIFQVKKTDAEVRISAVEYVSG